MKVFKRLGIVIMSLCLLVTAGAVLGGCGKSKGGVKIVMDNSMPDQYTELFKKIGDDLGINIELSVAPGNYEQFLQTQLQSSEKPDLFKLNGQALTGFVKDGMTTDLNSYFNDSWKKKLGADNWEKLTKGAFNQCRREADNVAKQTDDQNAPLWAIPFDTGCQSLGINRGIIEATPELAGRIDELVSGGAIPCKPWEVGMEGQAAAYTYSEFAVLLSGLQDVIKEGNLTGLAENLAYAFQGSDAFKLMTYSAGGAFLNEDNSTVTLTDDAVVNAAYFMKNGINEGYIDSMQDGGEGWNNWVSGKYLFSGNTGTWEYGTYLENESTISMMPVPVPDDADRNQWVGGQTGSSLILRKGSSNTELAAKVMCEFISRTSETYQLENAMNMPMYDDSWDDFISNNDPDNGGFYPYDSNCKSVYNAIISGDHGQVQETYYTLGRSWWSALMTDFTNIFCVDTAIVSKQDVADWLNKQQAGIQALLDEGN